MSRRRRPWLAAGDIDEAPRKAVWFDVFNPFGRRLGMFLGMAEVDDWVRGRPGIWWGVVHWYDGRVEGRWNVRARVKRARGKPRRVEWRKHEKGGGNGVV